MASSCALPGAGLQVAASAVPLPAQPAPAGLNELVLAGGCFWCTEAVFAALDGVLSVESGYTGGTAEHANYKAVCAGDSGHAEAIRVRFDPRRIEAGKLLQIFFAVAHDPTQLNRQGNDRGRQYRSAVFFHDAAEQQYLRDYLTLLDNAQVFAGPVVTTLEPLTAFYRAETYHQNYAAQNPYQPYIQAVARPKMAKLQHDFADVIRDDSRDAKFDKSG